MTSVKTLAPVIALWAGLSATAAQAATVPCMTRSEANGLFTAVLPDMLGGIGAKCSAALPTTATLRGGLPALVAKYRPAADAAWPQAMAAIGKLGGKDVAGIDPAMIKPMAGPMIAAAVADGLKPGDCPTIDRAVTLLMPLPAENIAELIVILADEGMKGDKSVPFTICKAEQAGLPPVGIGAAAR